MGGEAVPVTRRQKAAAAVVLIASALVLTGYATWEQWAPFAMQALGAFQ